jgi:HAD superfamily hydrolase (TIGR01549 family)
MPGVTELLSALDDAKIPYAILTNGWNPLQQCKADCIGFHHPVFVSDDIGVRKPNVHAFNVLRDYFELPAERIWYVGDDPKMDVLGSLGAGMRAIWFDFEDRLFPTDIPAPTAIVKELPDITRVIAA